MWKIALNVNSLFPDTCSVLSDRVVYEKVRISVVLFYSGGTLASCQSLLDFNNINNAEVSISSPSCMDSSLSLPPPHAPGLGDKFSYRCSTFRTLSQNRGCFFVMALTLEFSLLVLKKKRCV